MRSFGRLNELCVITRSSAARVVRETPASASSSTDFLNIADILFW
jgi:hypothetical protein